MTNASKRRSKPPRHVALQRPDHPSTAFVGQRGPEGRIDFAFDADESQQWECMPQPPGDEHPPLWLRRVRQDAWEAHAAFVLRGIASRSSKVSGLLADVGINQHLMSLLGRQLADGQRLRVVHHFEPRSGSAGTYRCLLEVVCMHPVQAEALQLCQQGVEEVALALKATCGRQVFSASLDAPPVADSQMECRYRMRPLGLLVRSARRKKVGYTGTTEPDGTAIVVPFPPTRQPTHLSALFVAAGLGQRVSVVAEFDSVKRLPSTTGALKVVREALEQTDLPSARLFPEGNGEGTIEDDTRAAIMAIANAWSQQPMGFRARLHVFSDKPVSEMLLNALGDEFWQGRPIQTEFNANAPAGHDSNPINLADCIHAHLAVPPVFADIPTMEALGIPRVYLNVPVRLRPVGAQLGQLSGSEISLRLAQGDRDRHLYVVGASGTGKSTLLANLIRQDISAGRGLGVMDPHGDLFDQILEMIPAKRKQDVVIVDPSDGQHAVGLNYLELPSDARGFERNFVINGLNEIFNSLYNMREAGGPGFEQYMRNGVMLLWADPGATLVDIVRVFSDKDYRNYLLSKTKDPLTRHFWEMATRTRGDQDLANWGPYVTSKFSQFINNELVRTMIGQAKSTIDFREIMDSSKILLMKLSKGVIGPFDSRFLGMLFFGKLQAAAMSRATLSKEKRKPFCLYVDEFQNFTTQSVGSILAEGRKYGLSLALAHQNFSQVDAALRETVHGNISNKVFFRLGAEDAQHVEKLVQPHFSADDLLTLPDHHFICRILSENRPLPPLLARSDFLAYSSKTRDASTLSEEIREFCRQKYMRPVAEVDAEIANRLSLSL